MSSTYRVVVKYGVPLGRQPQDAETYWIGFDEVAQLIDNVVCHDENREHGSHVASIQITRFGGDAGLQRERLFDETGY